MVGVGIYIYIYNESYRDVVGDGSEIGIVARRSIDVVDINGVLDDVASNFFGCFNAVTTSIGELLLEMTQVEG